MAAVTSRTGILVPPTVTDLADFAARLDDQLLWVEQDPAGAARCYRSRLQSNPYGGDGLVQLRYGHQPLIAPDLWDNVDGIWEELIGVVEEYLDTGTGQRLYPGQPVPIRLVRKGRSTTFQVGNSVHRVDPRDFLPGLLESARDHFRWLNDQVGLSDGGAGQRIADLQGTLPRR
ncbi:hypothetical protein OK351_08620 [Glutamicibacter sp. MNS18]|uniref:hypothetical protein n=1 Tax=Glutamicibacter sp. MNS18 TaxID=2989817 RepID=UPI0022365200|nr:hypothetical protein [Glutamicibacter sp. MNS18]MCW4465566.1 hypothetical protein [Glutamicibacter sp. MNS18]